MQADLFQLAAPTYRAQPLTDTPRSRATDPEPSHIAAEKMLTTGALGRQQRIALDAVQRYPGHTAVELANLIGMDRYAISRRLPELMPVHVRRGKPRPCTINGRPQSTWWPIA